MSYYKALSADGRSCNGGHSKWSLPILQPDGTYQPGRWMRRIENIVPCKRGYHVFERKDILHWANATLYEAEVRGETIDHGDKIVAESARLIRPVSGCNERTLRLFACRVAEDVLPLFEAQYPDDYRPRKAIETARRHADGKATDSELASAWTAAWAAADAAWTAARAVAAAADAAAAPSAAAANAARAVAAAADAAAADAADAADAAAAAAAEKYTDRLWEMIEGER